METTSSPREDWSMFGIQQRIRVVNAGSVWGFIQPGLTVCVAATHCCLCERMAELPPDSLLQTPYATQRLL